PNFFRRLFAEGAFNNAFVPMFSSILAKEGEKKAIRFSESIFAVMAVFLLGFTLIFQIAMPVVMLGFAPGFVDEPEKFNLAVLLTRITFPYLMFISLTALLTGVLNSFSRFSAGASAPIALNIILIWMLLYGKDYT